MFERSGQRQDQQDFAIAMATSDDGKATPSHPLRQHPEWRGPDLCDHCESEEPLEASDRLSGMCAACWPRIQRAVYRRHRDASTRRWAGESKHSTSTVSA